MPPQPPALRLARPVAVTVLALTFSESRARAQIAAAAPQTDRSVDVNLFQPAIAARVDFIIESPSPGETPAILETLAAPERPAGGKQP